MAYTVPQFNLLVKRWTLPNTPNSGGANQSNIPAQLYIPSRMEGIEQLDGFTSTYYPPIIFRLPAGVVTFSRSHIFSGPSSPQIYYRVIFADRIHPGFPNQYDCFLTHQCDGNGDPPAVY